MSGAKKQWNIFIIVCFWGTELQTVNIMYYTQIYFQLLTLLKTWGETEQNIELYDFCALQSRRPFNFYIIMTSTTKGR